VNNGVTTFTFEEDEILKSLVKEFYSLRASVEPTKYANAIKTLKSLLHASKVNANTEEKRYVSQHRRTIQ
jgi:hypothetical protein